MRRRFHISWVLIGCTVVSGQDQPGGGAETVGAKGPPPAVRFDDSEPVNSREGHATLSWTVADRADEDWRFEVQQSFDHGFDNAEIRNPGGDRSMFVSGLPDGTNYFRIRAVGAGGATGEWSEPLRLVVDYPGRGLVLSLFGVGCLVFVATVVTVLAGHRRHVSGKEAG